LKKTTNARDPGKEARMNGLKFSDYLLSIAETIDIHTAEEFFKAERFLKRIEGWKPRNTIDGDYAVRIIVAKMVMWQQADLARTMYR
jgi:hypothetical protein